MLKHQGKPLEKFDEESIPLMQENIKVDMDFEKTKYAAFDYTHQSEKKYWMLLKINGDDVKQRRTMAWVN